MALNTYDLKVSELIGLSGLKTLYLDIEDYLLGSIPIIHFRSASASLNALVCGCNAYTFNVYLYTYSTAHLPGYGSGLILVEFKTCTPMIVALPLYYLHQSIKYFYSIFKLCIDF